MPARAGSGFKARVRVAVFALLLVPSVAVGQGDRDFGISVGVYTKHLDTNHTNENTQLVGLTYRDWMGARFVNSYWDPSYFLGYRLHTGPYQYRHDSDLYLQGNLYAGLVYGYQDEIDFPTLFGVVPGVVPTLGLGYKRVALEVLYVPTLRGGVFAGFLTWTFESKGRAKEGRLPNETSEDRGDGPTIVQRAENPRQGQRTPRPEQVPPRPEDQR